MLINSMAGWKGYAYCGRSFLVLKAALQIVLVTSSLWLIVKVERSITWQNDSLYFHFSFSLFHSIFQIQYISKSKQPLWFSMQFGEELQKFKLFYAVLIYTVCTKEFISNKLKCRIIPEHYKPPWVLVN